MSLHRCERCRGEMDICPDVYLCICAPPCRLSFCWRCHRIWMQGPCAHAFGRELRNDHNMVASHAGNQSSLPRPLDEAPPAPVR